MDVQSDDRINSEEQHTEMVIDEREPLEDNTEKPTRVKQSKSIHPVDSTNQNEDTNTISSSEHQQLAEDQLENEPQATEYESKHTYTHKI